MISRNAERKCAILVALCMAVALAFAACGGGGGSATSGQSAGEMTNTPTTTQGAQATPTPTLTDQTVIVLGGNVMNAVHRALPGATVIFPPGKYGAFTLSAADLQGPITLLADVTGTLTETSAAPVVVDASPGQAAIALSNIPDTSAVVLDGFTLRSGTTAGIVVDNSPGTIIEDCILESNPGDGARFDGSHGSLLFNSLIINNSGAGVRVIGTDDAGIFNNTLYHNADTGISIGDSLGAVVENNIINENGVSENGQFGIVVAEDSVSDYSGDYNLNYDPNNGSPYSPMSIKGAHDLMYLPQFIDPDELYLNFHLAPTSPAIDAGDPNTPASLLDLLQERTTQPDCTLDFQPVDLGYHYPTTDPSCPKATPTPRKK
jgi:parallel beta-helix repeat protein